MSQNIPEQEPLPEDGSEDQDAGPASRPTGAANPDRPSDPGGDQDSEPSSAPITDDDMDDH